MDVNYIEHMQNFLSFIKTNKISSGAVHVYLMLFDRWNLLRFPESFTITTAELLKLLNIKKVHTFLKYRDELKQNQLIEFETGPNQYTATKYTILLNIQSGMPKNGIATQSGMPKNGIATQSGMPKNGTINKQYINNKKNNKKEMRKV